MVYGCGCDVVAKPSFSTVPIAIKIFWLPLTTLKCKGLSFTHIWSKTTTLFFCTCWIDKCVIYLCNENYEARGFKFKLHLLFYLTPSVNSEFVLGTTYKSNHLHQSAQKTCGNHSISQTLSFSYLNLSVVPYANTAEPHPNTAHLGIMACVDFDSYLCH
jgi:hypothetical protein